MGYEFERDRVVYMEGFSRRNKKGSNLIILKSQKIKNIVYIYIIIKKQTKEDVIINLLSLKNFMM